MDMTTAEQKMVNVFVTYPARKAGLGCIPRTTVKVRVAQLQEKVLGIIAAGKASALYFGERATSVGPSKQDWTWRRAA